MIMMIVSFMITPFRLFCMNKNFTWCIPVMKTAFFIAFSTYAFSTYAASSAYAASAYASTYASAYASSTYASMYAAHHLYI